MNRLSVVCIGVRDMQKSLVFYKSLGFTTTEQGDIPLSEASGVQAAPPVVFFNNGGARLELFPLKTLIEDIGLLDTIPSAASLEGEQCPFGGTLASPPNGGSNLSPPYGGVTLAYNVRTKAEVGETIKLARKAGARILKEPQDAFWGGHHAYFACPDGAVWEVVWGEGFTFDENDLPLF